MNPSRIEQAIEEIYAFMEECKTSKIYPNKVVVAKDELYDLLDGLQQCAPEEISRYQKIVSNRDAILNEAHTRAEGMMKQAQEKTALLLDESELVQAANSRAHEIYDAAMKEAKMLVAEANQDSEQIREAAMNYTYELLSNAERGIAEALGETTNKYRMLSSALQSNLDVIRNNKDELKPSKKTKAVESEVVENLESAVNEEETSV